MVERIVTISNRAGMHARPAALLVKTASSFRSQIYIEKDSERVNGKSIMGVITLGATFNTALKIIADGPTRRRQLMRSRSCSRESSRRTDATRYSASFVATRECHGVPWPRYSASLQPLRRSVPSSAPRLVVLAVVLGVLAPSAAAAQVVELEVTERGGTLAANLTFRWDRTAEIVESLEQRLVSKITFTVRLYEQKQRIFPFMRRERMLAEKSVARSAFWDFLDNRYVVESDAGEQQYYASAKELAQSFFTITIVPMSAVPISSRRPLSVTARAQFEPVRLMPPLTIVTVMAKAATLTTPWARKVLP